MNKKIITEVALAGILVGLGAAPAFADVAPSKSTCHSPATRATCSRAPRLGKNSIGPDFRPTSPYKQGTRSMFR